MDYNKGEMLLKKLIPLICKKQQVKNIVSHQKGFSLLEFVISAAAVGVFSLLVQSMLVIGHSFNKSQHNLFESAQLSQILKQYICMKNVSFKHINLDPELSYSKYEEAQTKQDSNGNDYQVYYRSYSKLKNWPSSPSPLLKIHIGDVGDEPECGSDCERATDKLIRDKNPKKLIRDPDTDKPQYYQVYQDSHTVSALTIDSNIEFLSGYIFASRCVNNHRSQTYKKGHQMMSTFSPDALKKSALYILNLEHRPFYYPSTDVTDEIQCCKVDPGSERIDCSTGAWERVPRIYMIYIEKKELNRSMPPPGDNGDRLSVKIGSIQEFPEMQDMETIWSAGFIMSMNEKAAFSQSAFQMDTMILRNACFTSAAHIQKCPDMSFGENIDKSFIRTEVGSCSGYSSGVDTTSLIRL